MSENKKTEKVYLNCMTVDFSHTKEAVIN